MKKTLRFAWTMMLSGSVSVCLAASSPWDGTWKLNEAKSKMTGYTFTLKALPNGGFHLSEDNGSVERDYPCDGTDYFVDEHHTGTCVKLDDHHYKMAGKLDGKPSWEGSSVVSGDDTSLTNTATEHRPDGTTSTAVNVHERVGTGRGRAGTWKSVKSSDSIPDVMKLSLNGDVMRWEDPAHKDVTIAKLDGSLAHIEGPDAIETFEIRLKADGPNTVVFHQNYKGKPVVEGYNTLSADGRTLTQVFWAPGKPDDKQTYVYEKQ